MSDKYNVEAEMLAEAHWKFLERWMHMVFVDGFKHGYKHALDVVDFCDNTEEKGFEK